MPITHSITETEYEITDGKYTIYCTIDGLGGITLQPKQSGKNDFTFVDSKPETVKAIGELISYAAGLGKGG